MILLVRAARGWDPVVGRIPGPVVLRCDAAGGTILDVSSTGEPLPEGLPTLAADTATALPGLVDAHTHLCLDPQADPAAQSLERTDEQLLATARAAARTALAAGITTVRDLGDRRYLTLRLREELWAAPSAGPELFASGPPVTRTRGHCWFLGGEADGAAALAAAAQERASRGVDVVKVMATGGMLTPGWALHESQYSRAELEVLVRHAHHRGLPATAHAHGPQGILDAARAGFDGIEHATFITAGGVECDWRTVDLLAERGVVVSATEAWLPSGAPLPEPAAGRLDTVWSNLVRMHRRGVRIAISSDAGIHPRKPHDVLPHGAVLLARSGLCTADALAAVTAVPAAACGLGRRKGRLARGYDADVLLVDGDPLEDITALLRPLAVVRAGRIVAATGEPGELAGR